MDTAGDFWAIRYLVLGMLIILFASMDPNRRRAVSQTFSQVARRLKGQYLPEGFRHSPRVSGTIEGVLGCAGRPRQIPNRPRDRGVA
ncbi:MAG TPA: hypothetical protein VK661_05780 [Planctomycetota bacterium]|nr:hypothetical protein [Planctomycetota bacterium]